MKDGQAERMKDRREKGRERLLVRSRPEKNRDPLHLIRKTSEVTGSRSQEAGIKLGSVT